MFYCICISLDLQHILTNMTQHNFTLYGMRMFKDIGDVLFLKDTLSEGNIYNLFIANVTRDRFIKKGKVYLCHLTDTKFITKDEVGENIYHLFLLSEHDVNILLLERKTSFRLLKEAKLKEYNPYDHNAILDFKVVCIKESDDLYTNTQMTYEEVLQ